MLLPGVSRGNEQDEVQLCLMESSLCRMKMGVMNRIESSAEYPYSHGSEDRAVEASPVATLA